MTTLLEAIHALCDLDGEHHADTCQGFDVRPHEVAHVVQQFYDAEIARFRAALDMWKSHHMADATGHMFRCAKVNGKWNCQRGCTVGERDALQRVVRAASISLIQLQQRQLGRNPTHSLSYVIQELQAALTGVGVGGDERDVY